MSEVVEIKVPDIGDFKEVSVIEVLVKPGDTLRAEQSLITVESDKASMEIPSPLAGVVQSVRVQLGDKVHEGSVILSLAVAQATSAPPAAPSPRATPHGSGAAPVPPAPTAGPQAPERAAALGLPPESAAAPAALPSGSFDCDLLVLGGGPGGYSAAFRAADLGLSVILVERYPVLGGVCLNVGCIPSKALLHVAAAVDEARHLAQAGVSFGAPQIDLDRLRAHKSKVVSKLNGGLAAMAKMRKVQVVQGVGAFTDAHELQVTPEHGAPKTLRFKQAVIAAGSQAVRLPFLPNDPRIVTSTGALDLPRVPGRMLLVGGGIIGLEMGTVYSTLGARLDVVEMQEGLMPGADRDLVKVWHKLNAPRFDHIWLKTRTVSAQATAEGIAVRFEGPGAPSEPQLYDLVLQAVGRQPNGKAIGAERAGVAVSERGFIAVDAQMRSNVPHIFAIGDIVGQPMLAHKAVHEGHVAAEVAAGMKSAFDARVIPSVAYTDPELAWVGLTEDDARAQGRKVSKGLFPWSASGRAIANGRDEGFTKLLFDQETQRIVGGGIVGVNAGDMIGEVALAIEMGADALDIGKTIHPHPTLGESLGLAAEAALGHCTDLPPVKH